jgi:hypothetical protein
MRADRHVCFRLPAMAAAPQSPPAGCALADRQAAALGELLQVLACGEESAALAFTGLAAGPARAAAQALSQIAAEERLHERALRRLRGIVPPPVPDPALRRALLRFFHDLASDAAGLHFANIVALDSAVCMILGAMLTRGRPLAADPAAAAVLLGIRADEARHVRLARGLARELASPREACASAGSTRLGLVAILSQRGAAFDALAVDPDQLFRRLSQVPSGLVA